MSSELIGAIGVVVVIVLMFARMWIGLAMAIVGFVGTVCLQGWSSGLGVAGMVPYESISNYDLSSLPMFVLMGVIIEAAGLGAELYDTTYKWMGQLPGGLVSASILACALVAAISGSGATGTILMGKTAVPEMKRYNYDMAFATGAIACAGTLGILIPPSVGFIIYGLITEQSIGMLFMAGILPGILLTALFIFTATVMTIARPHLGPAGPKTSLKDKVISLKNVWFIVVLFVLILGGIYAGIFTATEAGAVGVFGSVLVAIGKRRLNSRNLMPMILDGVAIIGMILLLLVGAFMFLKFVGLSKLPFMLSNLILGLTWPPHAILMFIIFVYVILGMFLDIYSAIFLTIPITYPIITSLGFDPIWFGVIIVIIIEMGLITPPVGMNVFTLSGVVNIDSGVIFRGIVPFFIAMLVCIVILIVFPDIALVLPNLMVKH